MVDRVRLTSLASDATVGVDVIVMQTSTIESFSVTISMKGIEKDAAAIRFLRWLIYNILVQPYHHYLGV